MQTENSIAHSRGYFSFIFSFSYDILDYSKFEIDLSLLINTNNLIFWNLRCFPYKGYEISHDFAVFDYSLFSPIKLEYKKKNSNELASPYIFTNVSYTFKCFGS